MARNYSNVAEETSLSTSINNSDTSITVGTNTGYPSVPYTIIIDPGTVSEEVCEVTSVAGPTWTVTRGVDGTPATSHASGAVVVHGASARDFREPLEHIDDTTSVHGITNTALLVTTTGTQTLTNKTLTAPTINGGTVNSVTFGSGLTFTSPTLVTPTIADFTNATHDHSSTAEGGTIGGGGGSGTYLGAVYGSAAYEPPESGFGWQTITDLSLTYTAPSSWPTGATKLVYAVTLAIESSDLTVGTTRLRLRESGATINPPGEWFMGAHAGADDSHSSLWPVSLPTAGSHTVTLQILAGFAMTIQQRSIVAFVV